MAVGSKQNNNNEHLKYYQSQELKREGIMKERLESQRRIGLDYSFIEVKYKRFTIMRKDNPTEEDISRGREYKVEFTLGDVRCYFDSNKESIDSKINQIGRRLMNGSSKQ